MAKICETVAQNMLRLMSNDFASICRSCRAQDEFSAYPGLRYRSGLGYEMPPLSGHRHQLKDSLPHIGSSRGCGDSI